MAGNEENEEKNVRVPSSSDMSRNSFMVSGTLILCFSDALCKREKTRDNSQSVLQKTNLYSFIGMFFIF